MNLLSIDTSTKNFSLAVSKNDKIIGHRNVHLDKVLSSSIIPTIDSVLKKAKVPLKKIDGFAVGLGPGSFTSLRVGLATIKSLAFASKKPVVGISSLDAIAAGIAQDASNICVISDAKRNLVYASVYSKKKGRLKRKGKYLLTDIDDVLKRVKGLTIFAGDGIGLFHDKIIKRAKTTVTDKKHWYPQAMHLAQLAYPRFKEGKYDRIEKLNPLYLYAKDCQVRR